MNPGAMDNIERFNRIAAALFKVLYESFPKPLVTFRSDSLRESAGLPPVHEHEVINETGQTVKWLQDEGFIRYSSSARDQHFTMVVLTQKGLAAMNSVPDALAPTQTVGNRLKELGRETSTQTVGQLVQFAITGGIIAVARIAGGQ